MSSCQGTPVLFFEPSGVAFGGGAWLEVRVPCGLKLGTDEEVSGLLKLLVTTDVPIDSLTGKRPSRPDMNPFAFRPKLLESHWRELDNEEHTEIGPLSVESLEHVDQAMHSAGSASSESASEDSEEEGQCAGNKRSLGDMEVDLAPLLLHQPRAPKVAQPHRVYVLRLRALSAGVFVSTQDLRLRGLGFIPT